MGDIHTKPLAELHLILRAVLDSHKCLLPRWTFQGYVNTHCFPTHYILCQIDDWSTDDFFTALFHNQIEISYHCIYLNSKSRTNHISFTTSKSTAMFKVKFPLSFFRLGRLDDIRIFRVPVIELTIRRLLIGWKLCWFAVFW